MPPHFCFSRLTENYYEHNSSLWWFILGDWHGNDFKRFFLEKRPTTQISKSLIKSDDESEKQVNYVAVCQVIVIIFLSFARSSRWLQWQSRIPFKDFLKKAKLLGVERRKNLLQQSTQASKVFSFVSFFCSAIRGNFIFFLNYRSLQDQRLGMFFNSNIFISRSRSQASKIQIWIKCMKLSAMCA